MTINLDIRVAAAFSSVTLRAASEPLSRDQPPDTGACVGLVKWPRAGFKI